MAVRGVYVSRQAVEWVRKILDPNCSAEERAYCHRCVEELKEQSTDCLACGFQLACDGDSTIRHFGLQLLEHFVKPKKARGNEKDKLLSGVEPRSNDQQTSTPDTEPRSPDKNHPNHVQSLNKSFSLPLAFFSLCKSTSKYRWHNLPEGPRMDFSMQLLHHMSTSIYPMEQETSYVKESLARLVVELAKKTWPQQWPTFLGDLDVLTHYGATQVEVVLLVFRRLAEDLQAHSTSSLNSIRRREMSAALREQIGAIYHFLMQNLEFPVVPSLCGVALSTVTCYVEWMSWTDLLFEDCKLLRLLYSFISIEQLKTDACECLLAILARKGDLKRTAKEREKLLILLSKDALQVILDASMHAASLGVDEVQYVFLKRVCQVLVELGTSQIARLWDAKFKSPQGFDFYLKVMLEFFKHQSQMLCMTSSSLWSAFLTHSYIVEDPAFRNILPDLFPETCKKLLRVGNPCSSCNDAVTQYNRIDFDDPNEYITFYSMFRNRLTIMLIRMCQKAAIPDNAFAQTLKLATTLTQQSPSGECSKESMLYLEWDGFVAVLESWTSVMKAEADLKPTLSEKATELTHLVLNYDPRDALVLCCVLRCMLSGLLWVLDLDPNTLLQPYLQKDKKVLAAQNIAMQCFVKLCTMFGGLLLPYLGQLFEQFDSLIKQDLLTYSMKSSFIEGFIILNQLRPDMQQQTVFLTQLMQEANTILKELQQCGALSSLEGMVQYLGIHITPSDPSFRPDHRAQLCYVAHVISVILKKSDETPPGTVAQAVPASAEQQPSYQLTVPLLSKFVLPLIGLLHELWSGKAKSTTSAYFQGLYELSVAEKEVIRGKVIPFGSSPPSQGDDNLSQMQNSLVSTLEVCLQCVANAFSMFGCKHMLDIGFVDTSIQAIFPTTAGLNCWKMRGVKLRQSWATIEQGKQSGATADYTVEQMFESGSDGEISQEVVDEQFAIFLSRDYASLLETVCMAKKEKAEEKEKEGGDGGGGERDEEMEDVRDSSAGGGGGFAIRDKWMLCHDITPLAMDILTSKGPFSELLIISVFSGLAWGDTRCAHTFTNLAGLIIMKIPADTLPPQTVKKLFEQVLVALQKHGMHEGNRDSLISLCQLIYETMVNSQQSECVTQLQEVLIQLPGNNADKMRGFHTLMSGEETLPICKRRRAKFRELLSGMCGGHISESFKRPVVFDLPEMVFKKQAKEQLKEPVSLVSLFGEEPVDY